MSECSATTRSGAISLLLFVWLLVPALATAGEEGAGGTGSASAADLPELRAPTREPPRFRLAIGPLTAVRTMRFEGDADTITHRPEPYLGGWITASGRLWHDADLEAFVTADLEVGHGVARNSTYDPTPGPPPSTELTVGGARLSLDRRLGARLLVGLGLGATATSVTLEPNPRYTGHRYLAAEAAVRVQWLEALEAVDVTLELGPRHVVSLDNSEDGHGEGTGFGLRAEGEITWRPAPEASSEGLRHLRLIGRYRYQRYRSQFPTSFLGSRGAVSVDDQHLGLLLIGYAVGR